LLRNIFLGNLRVKGMALIMAIALWFYAINKQTGEITEDVKLIVNPPPGLTILDTSDNIVTVSLRGPHNVIERVSDMIKDNKIKARYDFPGNNDVPADKAKETIRLTRRNFNFPQEIRLNSIVPNEINVVLGKLVNKYLKVQVEKKGTPALGYDIVSEFFYPHKVLVKGPANMLEEAKVINTVPIDISGLTGEQNRTFPWTVNLEQSISVLKGNEYISVPIHCKEKINVWFQVSEKINTGKFEKIKVNILHPINYVFKVKLKEEYIDLSIKGPKLILDKLESSDITAYIDVGSLALPGPYKQPVICNIPEGLEIEGKPPEVFVDIIEETVKKDHD